MKRMRVYLSGGMQFAEKEGAGWRTTLGTWITESLGHTVIDPVIESRQLLARLRRSGWSLRGRDRVGGDWERFFRMVVDHDIRLVRSSDYVVCLWNGSARRGAGTQGELTIARESRIPVFLVTRSQVPHVPGWVQGCSTRTFRNFTELRRFLAEHY